MQKIIFYLTLCFIISIIAYKPAVAHNYCKNGLIAYWTFDDGTAKDVSGNDFHGTIMNSPQRIKGVSGDAFYFTGRGYFSTGINSVPEGDHILLPRIPFEELGEFSLTLWVKEDGMSNAAGEGYFFFGDHVNGWLGLMNVKQYDAADTILYTDYAVGASEDVPALKQLFDFDERAKWIFYTMTYKNGVLTAYRDGKYLVQTNQNINIQNVDIGAIARHWWKWGSDIRTSARFSGAIDEVKLFCKALTDEEVMEEYKTCEEKNIDKLEIAEAPKPQKKIQIDLGKVQINEEKNAILHFKNISTEPAVIYNLEFKNNNFYVVPGTAPFSLAPAESRELIIHFKKNIIGIFKDELKIKDVCSEYTVELQAEVKANPCKNGLIAYWSFDDSTAKDNSGNGYDGTIMNNPKPVKGYDGKGIAFQFTGNGYFSIDPEQPKGDHILLPAISFDNYDSFTISLWVKEIDFTMDAGEAYLYFGEHLNGWLGIMNHKVPYSSEYTLFTQFSTGGTDDSTTFLSVEYDKDFRAKWKQYVLVYENGKLKGFINGIKVGEKQSFIKLASMKGGIACHWWQNMSSARFTGIIDEVKIYCTALSSDVIKEEYDPCKNADLDELEISESPKPQKGSLIDFGVVGINEQKSKSLHLRNRTDQPITINKLTFANNNYYFANGVFPLTIEPLGESELQIFFKKSLPGLYQDELIISDICTQYKFILKAEIPNSPCSNGMIAYWSFDDSTANDNSGNNYNGSIRNRVEPVEGMNGNNALRFYGQGSVGDLGGHILLPKIDFTTYPEFTLSFWVKNDKPSHYHGESYISFGNQTIGWLGINNHKMIEIDNGILFDHFSVGSNNSSVLPLILDYKNEYRDNWVSYAMTYKNGKLRAYRNGSFEGEIAQSVSISQPELSAIARHWWSDYGGNLNSSTRFNGIMDEVKIRCKALSDTEIETEFGPCALGFGNIFEIVGMPSNDSLLTVVFDSVGVGSVVTRKIKIRNQTDAIVYLNSVYVSENVHFSIPQSILPLKFASKEEKEIEVYLMPQQFNKLRDTLVIQDVCTTWLIALEADSYGEVDTLLGNCETNFEYSVDSLHSGYYMSLRSPRVTSSSNLVRVDFETNYEGTPQYREIELYNSIGDVVAKVQARVEYLKVYQVRNALVRQGILSFSKENFSSGLYFIKSESGMVGLILED